jgi:hypothetical protein
MGTIEDIGNLFFRITPSFRKARNERNRIKSDYLKNKRDLLSEDYVILLSNYETGYLGDKIESQHYHLEKEIKQVGIGINPRIRTVSDKSGRDRGSAYRIPEEYQEEIKIEIENIISKIKRRNRLSYLPEFLTYAIVVGLILAFFYFL